MLKHLQKFFNVVEKEPEMVQETTQAPVLAVDQTAELASAQAALASQAEALSTALAEVASLKEGLAASQTTLAAMVAEAKAKQLAARKERVEMAIGTEKAPALLAATDSMEDAAFDAVVSALAGSIDQEAKGKMFTETGVSAEAKPVSEEDTAKRLAAAIDAELKADAK